MTDDLRSTLEASVAAAETSAASGTPMPETVTVAPAPAPADDKTAALLKAKPTFDAETGKEVPEQKPSPQKPADSTGTPPPEGTETDVTEQKPATEGAVKIDKAPQSWKPSEKAKWDALDPGVRTEVIRRERETTRVIQESANARKFQQGFAETVRPYAGRYQQLGIPPTQVVAALLHADNTLATAPRETRAKMMAKMIKDYEIDLELLDGELSGQVSEKPDPLSIVDQRIQEALKPFQTFVQTNAQERERQNQQNFAQQEQVVAQMESDPQYPLMSMVREDMADIIENNLRRGVTVGLPEAYNRAVRMNPEAFAEAEKLTKQSQAQKLNATAQRALGASLSVGGNPSALATTIPASDLRGTIEAAVLAAQGR